MKNKIYRWLRRRWPIVLAGVGLACCLITPLWAIVPPHPPIPLPTKCASSGVVWAWIDLNENGIKESGELPLPGVEFKVDDVLNDFADVGTTTILGTGRAKLSVSTLGCLKGQFEVYVLPRSGYELTTPERLLQPGGKLCDPPCYFGFIYEDRG